jgi:hypothetical protein
MDTCLSSDVNQEWVSSRSILMFKSVRRRVDTSRFCWCVFRVWLETSGNRVWCVLSGCVKWGKWAVIFLRVFARLPHFTGGEILRFCRCVFGVWSGWRTKKSRGKRGLCLQSEDASLGSEYPRQPKSDKRKPPTAYCFQSNKWTPSLSARTNVNADSDRSRSRITPVQATRTSKFLVCFCP